MNELDDIKSRIRDVLAAQNLISASGDWDVKLVSGGLNSRVYLARESGRQPAFIVRLAKPGEGWLLRREAEALSAVTEGCECVPSYVALFDDGQFQDDVLLIHSYSPGSPRPLGEVPDTALAALADCLVKIHSNQRPYYAIWPVLKPVTGNRATAFRDRLVAMERYKTFDQGLGHDLQERVKAVYNALTLIALPKDAGWSETTFSQLHGDLSVGNIIWDGVAVHLIDWEFTRAGDPAEELAYVFTEQPIPPEATTTFYEHYTAAGGDQTAVSRSTWYAPAAALDSTFWWGDYLTRSGINPSTAPEVLSQLERAEAHLRHLVR